jgi:gamma-glutamyltranspeptidase/glutathione hydrolase
MAPGELDTILKVENLDVARIPAHDERLGHAQIVRRGADGSLQAAADPRSDGTGCVYSSAGRGVVTPP